MTEKKEPDDHTQSAEHSEEVLTSGSVDDKDVHEEMIDADPRQQDAEPEQTELTQAGTLQDEQTLEAAASASGEAQGVAEDTPLPPENEPPAAQPPKSGRGLAGLALFLALLGAAGVGYLYYLLVYQDPLAAVNAQQTEVDKSIQTLSSEFNAGLDEVQRSTAEEIAAMADAQQQQLAENEAKVLKSLNEALQAAPPSQRKWKLAEAEYLMRIANHRVLMEQDSSGALNLLLAADEVIAQLDDFALHQVRARLADEIVALRQVRRDDLQGIYLRIEAVKGGLANLSFLAPAYQATTPQADAQQTVWQTLWQELQKFVRVRTLKSDESIKPLLAPDEEQYLELNIRLALQQAQSAALKRQQAVFESSLQSARGWIERYMSQDEAAQALVSELSALLEVELARPLPDISGSLNELLSAVGTN